MFYCNEGGTLLKRVVMCGFIGISTLVVAAVFGRFTPPAQAAEAPRKTEATKKSRTASGSR